MSRYSVVGEGQVAQPAGLPSGTTFNGYWAALMAGAAANFKMRRARLGVRAGVGAPTSQNVTLQVFRQTVACAGSGFTTTVPSAIDPRSRASSITGLVVTTAAAAGTTGPTLGAAALDEITFNTQSGYDIPYEMLEEWTVDQGVANGIAFVNIGNLLPPAHLFTISIGEEE